MEANGFLNCIIKSLCFCALLGLDLSSATTQFVGKIYPGFEGSQMNWVDHDGVFLLSNNSVFALRFYPGLDVASFVLVVIHMRSSKIVWTANRGLLVRNTDKFVFDKNGNVYLENATSVVWSTDTKGEGVLSMELLDMGNLVLFGNNRKVLWQSFSHPTDTLLSGQEFVEGMILKSFRSQRNLIQYLEIKSNDVILYAGYRSPQVYWSMANDNGTTIKKANGKIFSASIVANSWNFYDRNKNLVRQFIFSPINDVNATWAAVLGTEGSVSFINLERGLMPELVRIPKNPCGTPEPCNPFVACGFEIRCQCPSALSSYPNCMPQLDIPCDSSKNVVEMSYIGEKLEYFALGFVAPVLQTHLSGCKEACIRNCSCRVLFFENTSGNCFLFDQIGSLQRGDSGSSGFTAYVKVQIGNGTKGKKHAALIVIISVMAALAIVVLLCIGFRLVLRKDKLPEPSKLLGPSQETSDEDTFLDNVSGMPLRFSYSDLWSATKDFSLKLGQGGFGSVYQGLLSDGTKVAVKKLEGIGQGKKEFRAEVSIIGKIHHVHLVKLKGFCAEGSHRLLVYEYMGKGSLDKWIFMKKPDGSILDWEKRFNIALGTAKGLAYLHEECDVKIVHCDIKPQNVLLDDNFLAKVSDFGLAKLMTREQSHVYTVVRGTRGYLAPEWIINHAISEKSDVYSFGMVLLEIIGGRKNYDPGEISEKAHFPSYVFKMMEVGKLEDIIDPNLDIDKNDERVIAAIKVALWCIQDEMHKRPPMSKVVQMLEGLCTVPEPPTSVQMSSRLYSNFFKSSSEEGNSSVLRDINSVGLLPDVELSGPR